MTSRYPLLYRSIQGIALAVVLLSLLLPGLLSQLQLVLALGLIVLIGIPHGATDYLIFQHLSRPLWGSKEMLRFYLNYLLLMAGYAVLWWLLPSLALVIFLVISMYHFGQSNWNYTSFSHPVGEYATHLLWGAFVLLVPILWHYDAAAPIIANITGQAAPVIAQPWREAVCVALLVLNIGLSIYFLLQQRISAKAFVDELVNLVVLALLFVYSPLLVGFALYFVGWHSLSSMMDQIRFFRKRLKGYNLKQYALNALPLSLAAVGSLGLLAYAQVRLGIPLSIGIVFIFISVVTLPHMLLIDQLYQEQAEAPA